MVQACPQSKRLENRYFKKYILLIKLYSKQIVTKINVLLLLLCSKTELPNLRRDRLDLQVVSHSHTSKSLKLLKQMQHVFL